MLVMTTARIEAVFRAVPEIKDRIMDELTCMDAAMGRKGVPRLVHDGGEDQDTNVVRNIITRPQKARRRERDGRGT